MHESAGPGLFWRIPKRGSAIVPLRVIPHALSPRRVSLAYAYLGRGALPLRHVSPMGFSSGSNELVSHPTTGPAWLGSHQASLPETFVRALLNPTGAALQLRRIARMERSSMQG